MNWQLRGVFSRFELCLCVWSGLFRLLGASEMVKCQVWSTAPATTDINELMSGSSNHSSTPNCPPTSNFTIDKFPEEILRIQTPHLLRMVHSSQTMYHASDLANLDSLSRLMNLDQASEPCLNMSDETAKAATTTARPMSRLTTPNTGAVRRRQRSGVKGRRALTWSNSTVPAITSAVTLHPSQPCPNLGWHVVGSSTHL